MTVILGNEVQSVTVDATGGTYTLTFGGQTTSAIAFGAAAATVQTALRALSTIGSASVTVTGNAGGPYTVTFVGSLEDTNVAVMTADSTLLTGNTHTATVAVVAQGDPPVTEIVYMNTSIASSSVTSEEVRIGQVPDAGYVLVSKQDYYGNS
jgi:hypothetical protein